VNSDLTALVDLGSSSVRFMLVRIDPGVGYRVLADTRARTRLGSGPVGVLTQEAIADTVEAVRRFLVGPPRAPRVRVLAIATAAVREAANAHDLLEPLRIGSGLQVEVLTAAEEGRLGAMAARASLQLQEAAVVDLGGSSLQISEIREGQPAALGSASLGVIRLTRDFLPSDPPGAIELDALGRAVVAATLDVLPPARAGEPLVAVGGTARALARLGAHEARRGAAQRLRVSPRDLEAIRRRLTSLPLAERRQLPGLKPSRADVIVAGAVVIEALMRMGGYAGLLVAEHGVRHGVLLRETFERVRAQPCLDERPGRLVPTVRPPAT
jgi:exopolyphosphatase/guanosine-5'-triphosphate,3'-diphosphate pyrophosphatase